MEKVYKRLDAIVCCSEFMKKKLDSDPILREKTVAMHNFISTKKAPAVEKQNYVLYFGRFAKEKGIETFLKACKALPDIPFVAAGSGPLEGELAGIPNLKMWGSSRARPSKNSLWRRSSASTRRSGMRTAPFR